MRGAAAAVLAPRAGAPSWPRPPLPPPPLLPRLSLTRPAPSPPTPTPCPARSDGFVRQVVIPGSLRKKEWVSANDILLVSLRVGMTDDKVADLLAKLYPEEVMALKQRGLISEAWQAGGADGEDAEAGFVFAEDEEDEDGEDEEVDVGNL